MRIFGGSAKGRIITVPKGATLRPSTDKTRLALYNAISALVPDARFLDLFCGTGAVGLEALSRGAAQVTFVDSQRRCIDGVREALRTLGFAEASWELLPMDYSRALQRLSGRAPFDLVFLDPPYDAALGKPALQAVRASGLLARRPGTRVILEHAGDQPSPSVDGLELYRHYEHGAAALSVYGLAGGEHADRAEEPG
jgi:16S rRNA (guanine(966)-N(2))-methyltransferase RsmD